MTLRIVCNICDSETDDKGFMFEASIVEELENLASSSLNSSKQMTKSVIHICKNCYEKNIKHLLYGKKK